MIKDEADINLRITAYNLALTDPGRPTPQSVYEFLVAGQGDAEVLVLHSDREEDDAS